MKRGSINYIYSFKGQEVNENVKTLMESYKGIQNIQLHKLDNITDEERTEKKDYVSLMKDNLEEIKKELYQ